MKVWVVTRKALVDRVLRSWVVAVRSTYAGAGEAVGADRESGEDLTEQWAGSNEVRWVNGAGFVRYKAEYWEVGS